MLDLALTPEQELLVQTTRDFVRAEFPEIIKENDRLQRYDPETFPKLAKLGLAGISVPKRYGGAGMDYLALGLVMEELEYVDASIRTVASVHNGLCSTGVYQWGTEEQRARLLRPLAEGSKMGAFGLTEPDAGSDVAAMRSSARREGDAYVLNGEKAWVSFCDFADYFLVFAYTDREAKHNGISAFILERENARGFTTGGYHDKLGLRAGNTGALVFDDVEIPAQNRIGEEGDGFRVAMSCLDVGRFTVAAGAAGAIKACLDLSVDFCHQRQTFGKEIGRHQLVQARIAAMQRDYDVARMLYFKAAYLKNKGIRNTRETGLAKWVNTEAAFAAADSAIQVFGSSGYSGEYPVERIMRNARAPRIYEGTTEIHQVMQAEYALGYRQDKDLPHPLPAWDPVWLDDVSVSEGARAD
ncbi:MAG TPA: acyl-CoA dehydrogenase family protein [Candidatus Dormibacteraeota bacterium]|nr:acyl-CoA dehydrogenase family protein [Candidatus Dormibacteraeota bacterium]